MQRSTKPATSTVDKRELKRQYDKKYRAEKREHRAAMDRARRLRLKLEKLQAQGLDPPTDVALPTPSTTKKPRCKKKTQAPPLIPTLFALREQKTRGNRRIFFELLDQEYAMLKLNPKCKQCQGHDSVIKAKTFPASAYAPIGPVLCELCFQVMFLEHCHARERATST